MIFRECFYYFHFFPLKKSAKGLIRKLPVKRLEVQRVVIYDSPLSQAATICMSSAESTWQRDWEGDDLFYKAFNWICVFVCLCIGMQASGQLFMEARRCQIFGSQSSQAIVSCLRGWEPKVSFQE